MQHLNGMSWVQLQFIAKQSSMEIQWISDLLLKGIQPTYQMTEQIDNWNENHGKVWEQKIQNENFHMAAIWVKVIFFLIQSKQFIIKL